MESTSKWPEVKVGEEDHSDWRRGLCTFRGIGGFHDMHRAEWQTSTELLA